MGETAVGDRGTEMLDGCGVAKEVVEGCRWCRQGSPFTLRWVSLSQVFCVKVFIPDGLDLDFCGKVFISNTLDIKYLK